MSLYLWSGEGVSQRNLLMLEAVACVTRSIRGPWIIAVDAQNLPEDIAKSGWLAMIDGVTIAPDEPTCGDRKINFFIVSRGLEHAVEAVYKVNDGGVGPHALVRLLLRSSPRAVRLRRLAVPPSVPAALPPACCPSTGPVEGGDMDVDPPSGTAESLDAARDAWIASAEDVWASIMTRPAPADFTRRRNGPRFAWRPAIPKVGRSRQLGTPCSILWRGAAAAVMDILWAKSALRLGWRLDAYRRNARARWRLASAAAPSARDSDACTAFRIWVNTTVIPFLDDDFFLESALCEAIGRAEKAERAHKAKLMSEWKVYISGGRSAGIGRQHRYLRGPQGWAPSRIGVHEGAGDGYDPHDDGFTSSALREVVVPLDDITCPLGAQQATEAEADDWGKLWL